MNQRKRIQVTPLGSMGWIPIPERHTAAYQVHLPDVDLFLDAGTGLSRLVEKPVVEKDLEKPVVLLLSHFHLDHTAGLIYLPALFPRRRMIIAAPGVKVYGESAAAIIDRLVAPPFFARPLSASLPNLEIVDLVPGRNRIAGLDIHCRVQKHTNPSLGIRLGNDLAYITDTGVDPETVAFAAGCPLLMHECWGRGETVAASGHSHLEGVLETARQAGVDHLMLIHLNPLLGEEEITGLEKTARQGFPTAAVARDLVPWPLAPGDGS